jgi:nitroreductase
MDFWDIVNARHSVRAFDPDADVSPQQVDRLLAAALRAPSAGNRQPWHFFVVRNSALKHSLASAAFGQSFVAQAPVVIVVCADQPRSAARYGARGSELYCLQDTAAAAEHILLGAVALGLGGCWVGAFDEARTARVLRTPAHLRPVAILPLGKPASVQAGSGARRSTTEVVTYLD